MNNSDERCPKTGLKRDSCYHCQAPPEYSIKEDVFKGLPVVELLHRGGPIHEFDKHFRFGVKKAKLIMACMEIIEELATTQYGQMPAIENQTVVDSIHGDWISVIVESFGEWQHSSGRTIKVPWIRLQSGKYPDVHIGFGQKKAKAIISLRRKIAEWVNLVDS